MLAPGSGKSKWGDSSSWLPVQPKLRPIARHVSLTIPHSLKLSYACPSSVCGDKRGAEREALGGIDDTQTGGAVCARSFHRGSAGGITV